MAIFKQKQSKKSRQDETDILDSELREELRQGAQEYFKKVIEDNGASFKQDLDKTIAQVSKDLKDYMTKQLDGTIRHVNEQIQKQLHHRLTEYDRVTEDAHDLAVQSLNRSAHALHEQYEQFNTALEKSIAGQESMMIAAYDENRSQIAEIKKVQDRALLTMERSVESSEKQRKRIDQSFEDAVSKQEKLLEEVFDNSRETVDATRDSQDEALRVLNRSASKLRDQYKQLSEDLQKGVDEQQDILIGAFKNNMSKIIEHYLLDALGAQYDMKAQLPLIIKQMEENKQAIVDDMKL